MHVPRKVLQKYCTGFKAPVFPVCTLAGDEHVVSKAKLTIILTLSLVT